MNAPTINFLSLQAVPAATCGITILPIDILLYLFQTAITIAHTQTNTPIVLSQVSGQWRSLVLETPTLWTSIKVKEKLRPGIGHFARTLRRVRHFLSMSAQCPLSVEISIQTLDERSTPMYYEEHPLAKRAHKFRAYTRHLSACLAAHVVRFEEFRLLAEEFHSIYDVQKNFPHVPMPLLRSWQVTHNAADQVLSRHLNEPEDQGMLSIPLRPQDDAVDVGDSVDFYPKLNIVRLSGVPMVWSQLCPRNLQTLAICLLPTAARPSGVELREMLLANEHSLQTLNLDGAASTDFTELYVMPNIECLKLGYTTPGELVPLLQCMRMPRLKRLEIVDHKRVMASVQRRPLLHFDETIHQLVTTLINNVPLQNLTHLALRHMRFLPNLRQLIATGKRNDYEWIRNLYGSPIPALLFKFMCCLSSLHTLTVSDPDYPMMACLNYWPPLTSSDGLTTNTSIPVPCLSTLELFCFNLPLIQEFFTIRLAARNKHCCLSELHLGMPVNWVSKLRFNLRLIADTTRVFDLMFSNRGEESFFMQPYQ